MSQTGHNAKTGKDIQLVVGDGELLIYRRNRPKEWIQSDVFVQTKEHA